MSLFHGHVSWQNFTQQGNNYFNDFVVRKAACKSPSELATVDWPARHCLSETTSHSVMTVTFLNIIIVS